MPPSRHSSSTHRSSSSSSRSSSHSSSSHRSSYSSHSSSSSSSYYKTAARDSHGLARPRKCQPKGYTSDLPGYKEPKRYHCKSHDYVYYGTTWVEPTSGVKYRKGYYDENGEYYKQIAIKKPNSDEITFYCEYCGTEVKTTWKRGAKPTCPNCSAQLEEMHCDYSPETPFDKFNYTPNPTAYKEDVTDKILNIIGTCILVCGGFLALIFGSMKMVKWFNEDSAYTSTSNTTYVEEIGRECKWLNEYESYYDPITDCYFWYNDEVEFPGWQYWYEGISSDYGDCGWMEFDEFENVWYIEVKDGDWQILPSKYDTSYLWYIDEYDEEYNEEYSEEYNEEFDE